MMGGPAQRSEKFAAAQAAQKFWNQDCRFVIAFAAAQAAQKSVKAADAPVASFAAAQAAQKF